MSPNPYLEQPNAEEQPCQLCGGTESCDPRCPEQHRCGECFALVDAGEDHDSGCGRGAEHHDELVDELIAIGRIGGSFR